jgi:rSAM/selenodomain-associated transferase 2
MKISVIIPALNEEEYIKKTLSSLSVTSNEEIIVIDGGSNDGTVVIARQFTDKVFVTEKGRGYQLGYGAEKASGDILLFLHADCILPDNAFDVIRDVMNDRDVAVGAFDLGIDHVSFCFRVVAFGANLRSWVTRVPYGDQGMFMRREIYDSVGGFSNIPIMEDLEISLKLKKRGNVKFVRPHIKASPRRWLEEGLLTTTIRDWKLALSYVLFNAEPDKLLKQYKDVR